MSTSISLTQMITSASIEAMPRNGITYQHHLLNEVTDFMTASNMAFYDTIQVAASIAATKDKIQQLISDVLTKMVGMRPEESICIICNSILNSFDSRRLSAEHGKLASLTFSAVEKFSQASETVFSAVPGKTVLSYHTDNLVVYDHSVNALRISVELSDSVDKFFEVFASLNREPMIGNGHYGLLPYSINLDAIPIGQEDSHRFKLPWVYKFEDAIISVNSWVAVRDRRPEEQEPSEENEDLVDVIEEWENELYRSLSHVTIKIIEIFTAMIDDYNSFMLGKLNGDIK